MIHTFADRCTYVSVIADERYQVVVAPHDHRPGPRSAFSDSEVITLAPVAAPVELDEEEQFLADVRRNHRARFPRLPERSRDGCRRRQLTEATTRTRGALPRLAPGRRAPEERDRCVIDRLPAPVVGCAHARGDHRWHGEASDGEVAAKRQTIFGRRRRLLITHGGLIRDFALAPARHADGALAAQLLPETHRLTAPGDTGSRHAAPQRLLAWRNDLVLRTPRRRTRATSVSGHCARIQAKLAAHTLGLWRNGLLGRPLLALKDLAVL